VGIGVLREHIEESLANRLLALESLAIHGGTAGRFKDAIVGHHRHQSINVVPVPCFGKRIKHLQPFDRQCILVPFGFLCSDLVSASCVSYHQQGNQRPMGFHPNQP
jgi:hypothetical protein